MNKIDKPLIIAMLMLKTIVIIVIKFTKMSNDVPAI